VIVNLHWGTEFQSATTHAQRRLAATLTRSEAITAVVGQHVHVVPADPLDERQAGRLRRGQPDLEPRRAACCPAASQDGLIALLDLRVAPSGAVRPKRVR